MLFILYIVYKILYQRYIVDIMYWFSSHLPQFTTNMLNPHSRNLFINIFLVTIYFLRSRILWINLSLITYIILLKKKTFSINDYRFTCLYLTVRTIHYVHDRCVVSDLLNVIIFNYISMLWHWVVERWQCDGDMSEPI